MEPVKKLPLEIYEAIKMSWQRMDRYFTSSPFTVEDMMSDEERIAYHKADAHFQGIDYDPADYGDSDSDDDDPGDDYDEETFG